MQRIVRNVLQESFRKQDSERCNLVAFQESVLPEKRKSKKKTARSKEHSPRKYRKTRLELV